MQLRHLEVPTGWSVDEIPVTLASLRVTGESHGGEELGGVEEQNEPDIVWCRSVVEQLDSATSACVVEIGECFPNVSDDMAWLQPPRVRLSAFRSSEAQQIALVAGAAASLRPGVISV